MATKSGRRYGASASDTEQQSWGGNAAADIARILTILEGDPISPDPLRRGLVGWTRTLRQENQALTEDVRALSTRLASIEALLLRQGGPTTPPTQKGVDDLETPKPGKEKEPSGSRRSTRFGGSLFGEEEQKPVIPQRRTTREPSIEEVEAPSKVKFPKPEKFTGAKGSAAKEFFTKCLVYFKGQGGYDNDEKKIMFILNSMGEGLPSRWANRYLEKIIEMEDDPALENIAAFREAFLSQWGDPVAKQNAERKIRALYQKGSAADYATEFRTVMPDLEWDNQALKGQF
ncbi:Retrotransposon Gag-like protein 3 [Ceratobasidium sp. 370]|nr:Retrotransposon Gag-like protein 3 [Ceratobasidium sp. 370]